MPRLIPVIDGHNDTLTAIRAAPPDEARSFLRRSPFGHIDLPRAREGGLAGGFFAVFTETPGYVRVREPLLGPDGEAIPGGWSVPLPPRLRRDVALRHAVSVISDLYRIERDSGGQVEVVRATAALRRCMHEGRLGAVLHIEGAECIDTRLEALDVLVAAGLRSLGLVWSRANAFATGVPFDFPRSPDTGPGLTAAGRRLVASCNRLGVLVDLSHLNEAGFWDVARITKAPLVCTHSGVHALCPSPRNLTDEQLDMIRDTGGVVGINFHVGFLRADGNPDAGASLVQIVEHARYAADRMGVAHVALGSDFDGAVMPGDLGDVTGLPRLLTALEDGGFTRDEVEAIAHGNWLRVLDETWRAA